MATQTTNYHLTKPALTDSPPDITVLNSNFDEIDSVMHANAEDIEDLQTLYEGKQNTLTFDASPTSGSNNPVKSGGIYVALKAVSDKANANETALGNLSNGKMGLVVSAVTGNIAVFDANGQVADGGLKLYVDANGILNIDY